MKTIEIKDGCRTKIKIVPDNYEESEKDVVCRDLTTSDRKSIGYSDISKERWDSIFKSKEEKVYVPYCGKLVPVKVLPVVGCDSELCNINMEDPLTIVSQSRDDSCVEEDLTLKPNYFRR